MADANPFVLNVIGVSDLVSSKTNKIASDGNTMPEGADSERYDSLRVSMTDEELLKLRDDFEMRYVPYETKLKSRTEKIRNSYIGKRADNQAMLDNDMPISANLQFEAVETFLAAALAKNPEPVVYCDNTPEGNAIATSVKIMLQFHADQLVLRRKITLMVRQWSMDLLGVLKPGWNERLNDVALDNRKVRDFIFDPEGFVDAYGDFSSWLGERIKVTAEKLIQMFPEEKAYILEQVDSKLGTECTYTEWWPSDEFCFYTFKDKVLDKFKNPYFKYPAPAIDVFGQPVNDPMTGQPQMSAPHNHFAYPKKPFIFLSVFSLQEHPHDITSLMEQNMPQQNKITRRTEQIDYNVGSSNNGYAYSEDNFNQETAKQASNARKRGNPILIPSGGPIDKAILALPAQDLPEAIFKEVETAKEDLRASWGIQGIAAQAPSEEQTARGMILNQSHDTTRIGGGIGDAIEQVADNEFNWLVQLYCVFYDDPHFAAIMGRAKAVEYETLSSADLQRQVVVSVSPDSMKPKDELTQLNLAQAMFDKGAIGPKVLLTSVDFPNPEESAADGALWQVDKMAYIQMNFPEMFAQLQGAQVQQAQTSAATGGALPGPEGGSPVVPPNEPNISRDPTSAALSNVPLPA